MTIIEEIAQEFITNMFETASLSVDFASACAELESYVLSRTTWDNEGNEFKNCPQDLYQTVSLPEGFDDLDEEGEDQVIQYLGDVWPDVWRESVAY